MTETTRRAGERESCRRDVLARLVAVEQAMKSLEQDVRAIDRTPRHASVRDHFPWFVYDRGHSHQADTLVVEVTA